MTLNRVERRGRLLLMMIGAMLVLMAGVAMAQEEQGEDEAAPTAGGLIPKAAAPLGLGIAALGSGIGLGMAVGKGLESMGRQPEMYGKLFGAMIVGAAFIEALTIYAFVAFLMA